MSLSELEHCYRKRPEDQLKHPQFLIAPVQREVLLLLVL